MRLRQALWLSGVWLCACNAVLGIEELKVKDDAGSGQLADPAQSSPDGGPASSGPMSTAAGSGGSTAKPDRTSQAKAGASAQDNDTTPAAPSGPAQPGAAGQSAPSDMTTPGEDGASGAAAEVLSPVTGTLIDFRGRKLPDVSVRIGDQQTTTDAAGKFTFAEVPARYDVNLLIQTTVRNSTTNLAWQFQGLSRRDPTLQVYRSFSDRFGEVLIHNSNVTFPLPTGQAILVGWNSPDGDFSLEVDSEDVQYITPIWSGPAMSTGTAHALLVSKDSGVASDFFAHDAKSVLMIADMQGMVDFDLGGAKPETALLRGMVTGPVLGDRRNEVYLRFADDDAALLLVDQWSAADSFEYSVPVLPGSTVTMVTKSVATGGGMAAAYAEVEPGSAPLALEMPPLPILAAPENGKTEIDGNTVFQWNSDAKLFVLVARSIDYFDTVYVVTESKQARLPFGAEFGYTPRANAPYEWSVEVHDAYGSIDEATSETGFLSAYGSEVIRGPRRGAGKIAVSVPRAFTTPP